MSAEQHKSTIANVHSSVLEPIAVIGMSCEFAGDVDSPEALWKVLKDSIDIGSAIPTDRLKDIDSYCTHLLELDPSVKHNIMRAGYFVNTDRLDKFDASFFGITDREAVTMDPCHRILLEKFVHLMEDADYPLDQIRGTRTAVYIGQFTNDHRAFVSRHKAESKSRFTYPNSCTFNASARISYHFNLLGPNLTLDTACSSSLQAVQLGIQSLRNNDADFAVVGGTNLNYTPETFLLSSLMTVISPDGRSRSYSSDGNGYAKGDGVGLVLLKKLSSAIRDDDRIYCLIHDVIANHDGDELKTGYNAPSPNGQHLLLTEIYTRNQLNPKAVFYVEGHGTGTQVGDPIEANTLGAFFNRSEDDRPLLIGSVKSNIGHTEGTSGVAALIKIAMCMKYRAIPPNMHFIGINPKIRAKEYNLHVVNSFVPFPKDLVTIGINSFGVGGNNAHAIVTEWGHIEEIDKKHTSESVFNEDKQYYLLVFTTKCNESMKSHVEKFFSWFLKSIQEITDSIEQLFLGHICFKRLFKRTITFPISTIFLFADSNQLKSRLSSFVANKTVPGIITSSSFKKNGNICLVFGGQGPQWWAMGRELYNTEPVFRLWIDKIDMEFLSVTNEWSLKQELINTENEKCSRINDTNIAQPSLFAVQVALTALWLHWGVHPKVIIGHSVGEIAAVFVAGRLTLGEAVRVIYHRARLQHLNTRQGGRMLAVSLSEADANKLIIGVKDRISIAAINSPQSVTLSGDSDVLEEIYDLLTGLRPEVFKTWLRVENAFHSHQMDRFNIQHDLIASLADIHGCQIPLSEAFDASCSNATLYSTVTGRRVHDDFIFNGEYWWNNMRNCVYFSHAMKLIIEDFRTNSILTYLEISPHPVLHSSIQECLDKEKSKSLIFPSLKRQQSEQQTILSTLCNILSTSDLKTFWKTRSYSKHCYNHLFITSILDHLPLYVFNNQICWLEPKESVLERNALRKQQHPLLGIFIWNNTDPLWKNEINLNLPQYSYLKDHVVQGNIIFPAAGFIEIAIAAVNELLDHSTTIGSSSISFENISIMSTLILNIDETTEIQTIVRMPFKDICIYSRRKAFKTSDGLASTDIVQAYANPYLYDYSQKEWTLHYSSFITIRNDFSSFTSYYNIASVEENVLKTSVWSISDRTGIKNLYQYLSNHDYQYGSSFQNIRSMSATESKVLAEIMISTDLLELTAEYEFEKYYFNPTLLDACLQTALICLSNDETFVPVSIDKLILFGKKLNGKSFVHTSLHLPVRGVIKDETFIFDTIIFDKTDTTPQMIAILQGAKIQKIPFRYKRFPRSLFEKLGDIAAISPDRTTDVSSLQMLLEHYCLKSYWKQSNRIFDIRTLLPTPNILLDNTSVNNDNQTYRTEIEKDFFEMDKDKLEQAIESATNFAAQYVLITIRKLLGITQSTSLKSLISSKHHKLYDSMINLAQNQRYLDENYKILIESASITEHTINMLHLKLAKQIPRFKSLLSLVAVCGENLYDVLTENINPLQLLFSPENAFLLQELYSNFTESNIKFIFLSLTDYLEKKMNEQQDFGENKWVLKILEVGGGTGELTVHILKILSDFANRTGTKIEYVFTDISSSFFERAQLLFSKIFQEKNPNNLLQLSYQQLDLEKSILKNPGLNPESFDIVFAVNVVHATSNIVNSLSNIRELMVPGGLVMVIEIVTPTPYFDIIFGMLPQWWTFDQNDQVRLDEVHAIMSTKKWLNAFDFAKGFEQFDYASNKLDWATIIARKSEFLPILNNLSERKHQVFIIFCDKKEKIGEKVAYKLQKHFSSTQIILVTYVDQYTDNESSSSFVHISLHDVATDIRKLFQNLFLQYSRLNIIFLWALDLEPLTDNFSNTLNTLQLQETLGCGSLIHILQAIRLHTNEFVSPNIFVFTQNAQPVLSINSNFNPVQSSIIGLTRSLILEYAQHRLKLIDIQFSSEDLLDELVSEILLSITSTPLSVQFEEISLVQDTTNHITKRYVPTLKNIQFNRESETKIIIPNINSDAIQFRLKVPQSRFIPDLQWVTMMPNRRSLSPTEVEIKIHSVGINFRDVLKVRGLFPHTCELGLEYKEQHATANEEELGSDFSGTIMRLGVNVDSTFKVGDTVFGATFETGAFQSHIIVDQNQIVHTPKILTMEEACTLPVAFCTVMFALDDRAHLKQGQSILIHTATGAVGIAAIQYCQMIGNITIICTAGSELKRQFLREKFGIKHTFNSRDLSFAHSVRQVVPNGVDIVVNTLAGALLQASIELLAPNSHFIELGKRDIFSNTNISLFKLRSDCSFHVIDLTTYQEFHPSGVNSMLKRIATNCENNIWKPIFPITVFEPSEVKEAFTFYHQTTNVGKLVIKVTSSSEELQLQDEYNVHQPSAYFSLKGEGCSEMWQLFPDHVRNSGTILISGGLGGIGIAMSKWMIQKRGVKRILLMSRRGEQDLGENDPQYHDWIVLKEIAVKYHASVAVVKADVTQFDRVLELIKQINESSYPLRGIIHGALVLQDNLLDNMTQEVLSKVMKPRIHGLWNLHYASEITSTPLHFFIMLSSIRNYFINFGASNYNSTNEFFDAFAHWRFNCKHLPALSIGIPLVSDVGISQRNCEVLALSSASSIYEGLPAITVFQLIEKLYINQQNLDPVASPIIAAVKWKFLHSQINNLDRRLIDIVEQEYNLSADKNDTHEEEFLSNAEISNFDIDKVINKIRLSVARLFGSSSIDRIDVGRPLIEQGLDSLTAVSLYNWLGNEFTVHVPLAEILRGISINSIGSYIQSKYHEQYSTSTVNTTIASQPLSITTDRTNGNVEEIGCDKKQNGL